MPRTPQDVTEAELSVLERLWESNPATIRQITDSLYPGGSTAHYATVQKLLDRLETKQCVGRVRQNNVHHFRPMVERTELIGRRLRALAERLCEGSFAPLLTHLVRTEKLSAADRASLRNLIQELEESPKRVRER